MNNILTWQQNSPDGSNEDNLKAIARWWSDLAGKEVFWQQRILTPGRDFGDLDWQPQKFDERLTLLQPTLRGVTLFWSHNKSTDERNITSSKLQLNLNAKELFIVPQSQSQVAIKVSLPGVIYQKIDLLDPQVAAVVKNGKGIILLRDEGQQWEITVTLDSQKLDLLRQSLGLASD